MTKTAKTAAVAIALFVSAAAAQPAKPELSLDAHARSEVANDLMTVSLATEAQGTDVHSITQQVAATVQRAVAKAKRTDGMQVRTGGVHTYPVWGPKGKTGSWQVRAELQLTSTDFAALGRLASELSSDMQITGMHFSLSPAKREAEEARLTSEVAAAFKKKAASVAKALGYDHYAIKSVSFGHQIGAGQPRPAPMYSMKAAAAEAAVPLPAEGGKSEVSLSISGTVELH